MGLALRMVLLVIVTVLLSLTACEAKMKDARSSPPSALIYRNHKLPTTPFPTFLLNRLSSSLSLRNHTYHSIAANHKLDNISLPPIINLITYTISSAGKEPRTKESDGTTFFLQKNIGIGNKFPVDMVRLKGTDKSSHFTPAVVANEIPFSTRDLSLSLQKLQIPSDSAMAHIMKKSLEVCERPAMIGESKMCVTSLESMIDYTISRIGTKYLNVFATNLSKITKRGLQIYSIVTVPFESKSTSRVVVCHSIGYAYLVHFCHQIKDTRMYQLSLKSDDGKTVPMVAVCHEDTSGWSPDHVSFKILNVKPGGEPICHFITEDGLVWAATN